MIYNYFYYSKIKAVQGFLQILSDVCGKNYFFENMYSLEDIFWSCE
jgi:hypothetical protein